ncbi:hypothetical protein JST97_18815 [bacterium]|nr:hypothetical protein [bacterium]
MRVTRLSYHLNESDVIVAVDDDYLRYAEANGGLQEPEAVIGQPIWGFIEGTVLPACLRAFFRRCWSQPGYLPYRCDSPDELRLWKVDAQSVQGLLQVSFEEIERRERPPLPVHGKNALQHPVHFCSWCNGVVEAGATRWLYREEAEALACRLLVNPTSVQHTLCKPCFAGMLGMDPKLGFEHLLKLQAGLEYRPESEIQLHGGP